MPSNKKLLQAAAGSAGGDNLFVEDVFSTYIYKGNDSTNQIVNGIDLSGEGGLVWQKARSTYTANHLLTDTVRGRTKILSSNLTAAEVTANDTHIASFNSDGFTLGSGYTAYENFSGIVDGIMSWSFRKAAGFCDIVTYTGNGQTSQTISHNLGSTPKMMIMKCTTHVTEWYVYHASLGANNFLQLHSTVYAQAYTGAFNNTAPTDTQFTVGNDSAINASGRTYVAYLFGDDAVFGEDGDEQICKMGTATLGGSGTGEVSINLGFEPQFVLLKTSAVSENWLLVDTMNGAPVFPSSQNYLSPNTTSANASYSFLNITSTGFNLANLGLNRTYIYMAIRRPMKVPEAGTEVFIANEGTPGFTTGFPVDFNINTVTGSASNRYAISRLTGTQYLQPQSNAAEATGTGAVWFNNGTANTKIDLATNWFAGVSDVISWSFKRAPKFMDVVAYTGTGSNRTLTHNLSIAPEMMWVKNRTDSQHWAVYHKHYGGTHWANLNEMDGFATSSTIWNNTNTTSSVFTVGTASNTNQSSKNYIAYLFGSLDGVSKVGSYTGNGSTQIIDCGFSAGARFVLIKKSSEYGNYMVFDSVRGIVSGNDPYIMLDNTTAEVTNTDKVDPAASGFAVNVGDGYQSDANESGQTYIFLAIA